MIKKSYIILKMHFKQQFLAWWVLVISLLSLIVGVYFGSMLVKSGVTTYFQQINEKKTLDSLETFHVGVSLLYTSLLERQQNALKGYTIDNDMIEAIESGDANEIQRVLDNERDVAGIFENNMIIGSDGIVKSVSSDSLELNQFVGKNFSDREYVKATKESGAPQVVHVSRTLLGNNKLFFTTPFFDKNGRMTNILTGSNQLEGLIHNMYLQPEFNKYVTLLIDQDGEILLKNGKDREDRLNIAKQDGMVGRLIVEKNKIIEQEINFEGNKAFAIGTPLIIGQSKRLFLVSYYYMENFETEVIGINNNIDRIYNRILMWAMLTLVFSYASFLWVFRIHDKKNNSKV